MQKLKSLLGSAIRDRSSSYREIARIAGFIISVALAVNVPSGNRISIGVGPHPSLFHGSLGEVKILEL